AQAALLGATIVAYAAATAVTGGHVGSASILLRLSVLLMEAGLSGVLARQLHRETRRYRSAREESARRATLLATVARAASSMTAGDPVAVAEVAVDTLAALGFDMTAIATLSEDGSSITFDPSRELPTAMLDGPQDVAVGIMGSIAATAGPVVEERYSSLSNANPALVAAGVRLAMGAPLWQRGRVVGALLAASLTRDRVSPEEIEALELLAAQTGRSLEAGVLHSELGRREAWFRSLVQHAADVVAVIGEGGRPTYASPAVEAVLGRTQEEMTSVNLVSLVHADDRPAMEAAMAAGTTRPGSHVPFRCRVRHRDGSWRHVEGAVTDLRSEPTVGGVVLNVRDVTQRAMAEEALAHAALHDALTGLANRMLFSNRLQHALARRGRADHELAVVYFDLDRFQNVNDGLGHAAGDEALREIAARLQGCLRPPDTLARLGGDEFGVLLEDVSPEEVVAIVDRLLAALSAPVRLAERDVVIGSSVGVSTSASGEVDPEALLRQAIAAMYAARSEGRGRWVAYQEGMRAFQVERLDLEGDLRQALERSELVLEYQPVVELATGAIRGVEALVRWDHPQRGRLSPDQFVPLAEDTGLIIPLGAWVLNEAASQARSWQLGHPERPPLEVAVNVSVRQLADPDLVETVARVLATTELDPALLTLEITETVLVSDAEQLTTRLTELKRLGVRLAIDDFGTGYSSLSHLRSFPVDTVKIDRSFVEELCRHPSAESSLAQGVVRLAESLRLEVVAEGIEVREQLDALEALRCPLGQGFYFARPLHPAALERWMVTSPAAASEVPPLRSPRSA
ncbi:MAG: putative bifunctional diguanylate cyclase/phosphodiesterase, partial [Acidimicrobiales bacterium]